MSSKMAAVATAGNTRQLRAITYLWVAMAGMGTLVATSGLYLSYQVHQLSVHNKIAVGMPKVDVITRLGQPHRRIDPREARFAPAVSGFKPHRPNTNGVFVYTWAAQVVYVYFDSHDRVAVYYVCKS